jgi:dephospho-CoA kinase
MLTIGITGGIGSGKSTACRIFNVLGIPVFQADVVAKVIQNQDICVKESLIELFGDEIYSKYGLLERQKLAEIIFKDKSLLEKVNAIIHPAVRAQFNLWKEKKRDYSYIIYEAAILFETGGARDFDFTILVIADEQERIERVMKRDHLSVEAIKERIKNQMKEEEKKRMADFILENNDNQLLIPQILKLDQFFKSQSHVWKMDR